MAASEVGDVHNEVMRLTQVLVAEADKVTAAFVALHRMHPTDVDALTLVQAAQDSGKPITAGALGEALGVTSGAITALVDRLQRAGNLRRVPDGRDRRKVLLENSEEGRVLTEQYLAPVRRRSEEVMDQFTPDELDVVSRYLHATAAAMAAHRHYLISEHHRGASATETNGRAKDA